MQQGRPAERSGWRNPILYVRNLEACTQGPYCQTAQRGLRCADLNDKTEHRGMNVKRTPKTPQPFFALVLSTAFVGVSFAAPPLASATVTTPVAAVSAGPDNSCALTTAGGVKCWGGPYLGDGTNATSTTRWMCPGSRPAWPRS